MAAGHASLALNDPQRREQPLITMRFTGHTHPGHRATPSTAAPVTHDYMTLAFYTGGTAVFEQKGRWLLGPGDVLLVPAGEPHRMIEAKDPEIWGLGLCPGCFLAESAAALLEPFERVRSGAAAVARIPPERRGFLESLFVELERETARAGSALLPVQQSLVTLILAEVGREASAAVPFAPVNSPVADVLRFIERRCLEPISLKDVATAVHRSPAHVTTLVRRTTGRTVQEWIIAGRLSEARRRLSHTDEKVEIIAERVGYADATHFIRLFRRAHGTTPAAWRARNRP